MILYRGVGDDAQALVWDVTTKKPHQEPILNYVATNEINQLHWSAVQPEWVAIAHGNIVEALHI